MQPGRYLAHQLGNPSKLVGYLLAPLWNKRNKALNDVAFAQLALAPNDRVLEVGFGGGSVLGKIASAVTDGAVVGVDVSPAMVAYCERHHRALVKSARLQLVCAGADAIPCAAGRFNKICTVNSVFYWPSVPDALSEFLRLLEAGGLLVMCFTCRESLERKRFAEHLKLYDSREIMAVMASCGFQQLHVLHSSDKHRQFACITGRKHPSSTQVR